MTAGRLTTGIERELRTLYRRRQGRYPRLFTFWICVLWVPALIVLLTLLVSGYADLTLARVPAIAGIMAVVLYGTVAAHAVRDPAAPALAAWWRDGRPRSGAAAVWTAVEAYPREILRNVLTVGLGLSIGGAVAVGAVLDWTVTETASAAGLSVIGAGWTAITAFFLADLWMRPVHFDVAAHLPEGFHPPGRGVRFAPRLLGSLVTASVLAAAVGAIITDGGESRIDHMLGPIVLAIAVAMALSVGLTTAGVRSMLRPIDALTDATRQLASGDLAGRAPVVSDDELGALAASFNEMALGLQRSREQLISAREEERRRLRRDLHDGLGPTLAGVAMRLEAARGLIAGDPRAADAMLGELRRDTVELIEDIRRLVHGLRPPQLDELGLVGAIEERAARLAPAMGNGGLRVTVDAPDQLPTLPAALEVAAFRIAEEALTNVVRHSGAHACTVRLSVHDALSLEVRDDGTGVRNGHAPGVGLQSMRERAAELGGSCRVEAADGGGTVVTAELPLPAL